MPSDSILYIDDEAGNITGFKYTFKRKFDVTTASSAAEALEILKTRDFKVIISDQRMPNMSGLDFFAAIQKTHPDVIKIILSAFSDNDVIIKAINEIGIYRFLSKPWNKDDMEITIQSAIESYNLKNENQQLISDLQKANADLNNSYALLEESEKKFRNIFNQSRDGIVISDKHGFFVEANPIALTTLGYTKEEIQKIGIGDVLLPKYRKISEKRREQILKNQSINATEIEIKAKDGTIIPVEIQTQLLTLNEETLFLSIIRDTT
ncbi:response regulator, partial [Marinilabilia sp.]